MRMGHADAIAERRHAAIQARKTFVNLPSYVWALAGAEIEGLKSRGFARQSRSEPARRSSGWLACRGIAHCLHSARCLTPHPFIASHRGIANLETREMSSLSVEASDDADAEIIVAVFEMPRTPNAIAAWLDREHEYRFLAVRPYTLNGEPEAALAVRRQGSELYRKLFGTVRAGLPRGGAFLSWPAQRLMHARCAAQVVCARFEDAEYKARRCPPDEWQRRYGRFGLDRVWMCAAATASFPPLSRPSVPLPCADAASRARS